MLRFCASFSLQTLKTMINIWPQLKFFSLPPSPGYVALATALCRLRHVGGTSVDKRGCPQQPNPAHCNTLASTKIYS